MKRLKIYVLFALVFATAFLLLPKHSVIAQGPGTATLTGTGACATITTQGGGAFAGTFKCTGTTGASTVTITPSFAAANGFECHGSDTTTAAVGNQTSPVATSNCKLNFTSVTQNDILTFGMTSF